MSTMTPEELRAECARLAEIPPWMISKGPAREAYAVAAQVPALLDEKEAALAENATLRQRIAEADAAAKTWEAEANRRSQRFAEQYEASRLAEMQGRLDAAVARIAELERDAARYKTERDFLVEEYERAVKCGPQGYLHAAMHLFNAIVNARIDAAMQTQTKEGGK
jgi:cell division septum initiation protein DivIVA